MTGQRIRVYREKLGLTQEQLAQKVNTTKQNIYKYETGIIVNIPLDKLSAIAKVLDVAPCYLAGWVDNPNSESESLTTEEERLLTAYRSASDDLRKAAIVMLESFHIKEKKENIKESVAT